MPNDIWYHLISLSMYPDFISNYQTVSFSWRVCLLHCIRSHFHLNGKVLRYGRWSPWGLSKIQWVLSDVFHVFEGPSVVVGIHLFLPTKSTAVNPAPPKRYILLLCMIWTYFFVLLLVENLWVVRAVCNLSISMAKNPEVGGPCGQFFSGCVFFLWRQSREGKWGNYNAVSSSWWFQPIWKILVKLDHFPK